jgi:hypothetical protein
MVNYFLDEEKEKGDADKKYESKGRPEMAPTVLYIVDDIDHRETSQNYRFAAETFDPRGSKGI